MTAIDLKGKKLHAVVHGDKNHKMFYAEIMNDTHRVMYWRTEKYPRFETLMNHVEAWAKRVGAKELSWDAKQKK